LPICENLIVITAALRAASVVRDMCPTANPDYEPIYLAVGGKWWIFDNPAAQYMRPFHE